MTCFHLLTSKHSKTRQFSPDTVSVGDLFIGAIFPGLLLVALYLIYIIFIAWTKPDVMPAMPKPEERNFFTWFKKITHALLPPIFLIIAVLGSIIVGIATPTEAASVGAVGAIVLALLNKRLDLECLQDVMRRTVRVTCMVFMIFIGASYFFISVSAATVVMTAVHELLTQVPGGVICCRYL